MRGPPTQVGHVSGSIWKPCRGLARDREFHSYTVWSSTRTRRGGHRLIACIKGGQGNDRRGESLSNKHKRYRHSGERNPSYIRKHPPKGVDRHCRVPHQLVGSPLVTPLYIVSLYNPIQARRRAMTHLNGARTWVKSCLRSTGDPSVSPRPNKSRTNTVLLRGIDIISLNNWCRSWGPRINRSDLRHQP